MNKNVLIHPSSFILQRKASLRLVGDQEQAQWEGRGRGPVTFFVVSWDKSAADVA
jgi:hypothetical protein